FLKSGCLGGESLGSFWLMSSRLSKLCPNESVLSQSRHWLSGSDIRDDDSIGFKTFFGVFLAKNTKNKK
ncbi:MAG: hypothetical protein KDI39_19300, partial [Pseudomonadales bacterium]|nr:hypothetical protein [Pseudomonadales bacterium]